MLTAAQLKDVVGTAIAGVKAVAKGEAGANLAQTIEDTLLGGIPLALSFAVKQVPGLEGLPKKVVDSLQSVSNKLEVKLTTLFKNLRTTLEANLKPPVGLIGKVHEFTVEGVTHTIWLAEQTPGGPLRVMLDGIGDAAELDLEADLPENLSAKMRQKVQDAVKDVLKYGGQLRNLLGSKPPKLKEAKALQAKTGDLGLAIAKLAEALVGAPCNRLLEACFCAQTLLRTKGGLQAIETFAPGQLVLSRDEHDPRGWADYKVVEEVFERLGWVWHLTAGGRLIRTTGEHPFQELTKGWVPCRELDIGDRLMCEDGSTVLVEEVVDTGEVEVVYNLRVADWHTYFVGGDDWGFAVWAHNACVKELAEKADEGLSNLAIQLAILGPNAVYDGKSVSSEGKSSPAIARAVVQVGTETVSATGFNIFHPDFNALTFGREVKAKGADRGLDIIRNAYEIAGLGTIHPLIEARIRSRLEAFLRGEHGIDMQHDIPGLHAEVVAASEALKKANFTGTDAQARDSLGLAVRKLFRYVPTGGEFKRCHNCKVVLAGFYTVTDSPGEERG